MFLVKMNKAISKSTERINGNGERTEVRGLNFFESYSTTSQRQEKGDLIPRIDNENYHKKFRVLRENQNWCEYICLVKKLHCNKDNIKIQDEAGLSAYSKCTKQLH